MRNAAVSLALAGILTMAAAPSLAADSTAGSKVFALHAQNGSNENGTVALVPQGMKTLVVVELTGAPAGTPQPAHVHVGPCATLTPAPTYALESLVDGVSMTTLDVPIAKLTDGTFAVNVHKSVAEIKTYVSCGNLKT
jgi:hypothetical protein